MAQKFLSDIKTKGPTAFDRFIAALRSSDQEFIADHLLQQLDGDDTDAARNVPRSSKSDSDIIKEVTGCTSMLICTCQN